MTFLSMIPPLNYSILSHDKSALFIIANLLFSCALLFLIKSKITMTLSLKSIACFLLKLIIVGWGITQIINATDIIFNSKSSNINFLSIALFVLILPFACNSIYNFFIDFKSKDIVDAFIDLEYKIYDMSELQKKTIDEQKALVSQLIKVKDSTLIELESANIQIKKLQDYESKLRHNISERKTKINKTMNINNSQNHWDL